MISWHNYSGAQGHGRENLQSIHQPLSLETFCSLCFDQSVSAVGEGSKSHSNVSSPKGLQTECHEEKERINIPSIYIMG